MVETFSEFCTLYFPIDKCREMIVELEREDYKLGIGEKLENLLRFRDPKSKKNLLSHLGESIVWKTLFRIAREVLSHPAFPVSKNSKTLLKCAENFLNRQD